MCVFTRVCCASVCVFGGRELINPVANMITLQPCGLRVNTNPYNLHTHTHRDAHTHTHTHQARPHCLLLRVSWLGDPTEADSTKISLQGSHVNTSRCNINAISHGKSPSGMAAREPASGSGMRGWRLWGFFCFFLIHVTVCVYGSF